MYDFTHMWNIKASKYTKQKEAHRYREQTDDSQKGRVK